MNVCVCVLGDVGRSPRMCYHALSLAEHGCTVDLIGYHNTKLPQQLHVHPRIRKISVPTVPRVFTHLPSIIGLGLKFLWMFIALFYTLLVRTQRRLTFVMVQNPPGVPTLAVCQLVTKLKSCKLVIDWHNYTYTVLQCQLEEKHLPKIVDKSQNMLVRLSRAFEWHFARAADLCLCVSHAMRADIEAKCKQRAIVLYDRPPTWKFPHFSADQLHEFVYHMATRQFFAPFVYNRKPINDAARRVTRASLNEEVTSVSYRDQNGVAHWRDRRPAVLLSSTSWTVDEDFRILLDALVAYDETLRAQEELTVDERNRLPPLIAVITGKGPQKGMYLNLISNMELRHVEILTPWLEAEDYPKMLGVADLGVCLHTSTSGLDLPMKVVDMFGCGLPVLARDFNCIGELVNSGKNGHMFIDSAKLAEHLYRLLAGFPKYSKELTEMRRNLQIEPLGTWEDNWDATAWPLLQRMGH